MRPEASQGGVREASVTRSGYHRPADRCGRDSPICPGFHLCVWGNNRKL